MSPVKLAAAEAMLRNLGARVTRSRVQILGALLASERALSQQEVASRIDAALGIDRVTVYRVLDWLAEQGLAHSVVGDDGVRRYNAAEHARSQAHAHFECGRCGTVICLENSERSPRVPVPRGFVVHEVALTLKGFCAACARKQRPPRGQSPHARH